MKKAAILACACGLFVWSGCAEPETPRPLPSGKKHAKKARYSDGSVRPFPLDLFGSAARGDLRGVQDALAHGASVDARNPAGATPLILASASGSLPVIQTLIGAGADVNAADNNGRTPLAAATAGGYDEIARVLRASGARGAPGEPVPGGGAGQWWQKDGASH